MNQPFAIIDLGTSTFKLGIYSPQNALVLEQVFAVGLGEGIEKGFISPQAFERGLACLAKIAHILAQKNVLAHRAIGTSALRNASNGAVFVQEALALTCIAITVINGSQEALLIYKGVQAAMVLGDAPTLILDIGGGSVECIVADAQGVHWHKSFEVGTSRLAHLFAHQSPILPTEIQAVAHYVATQLSELILYAKSHKIRHLCGASNAFDSLSELITGVFRPSNFFETNTNFTYKKTEYDWVKNLILQATTAQIQAMPQVPQARKPVMVLAMVLIDTLVQQLEISHITATKFSLKEGICAEFLEG